MKDNQKVVTISGKDIVVTYDPLGEERLDQDPIDWGPYDPENYDPEYFFPVLLQPGYYYDYTNWGNYGIVGPCHKPLTKKTWLEKCEPLIPQVAVKILREEDASSRIGTDAEFIEAVLCHVGDAVFLKTHNWHKRWRDNKSLYNSLKQNIETHYFVNKAYRVKCAEKYSPTGFDGCDHCFGHDHCLYKDETRVATVKSRATIRLERFVRYFTAMHPDIEAWGEEFIGLLAEDIELEMALSVVARRDTVTYFN